MAEIVGLVTGIGTIVATAFTIAKTISTVANDLGTAGSQIKAIATDTKAIAFVLRDLKGRIIKNSRKFDGEAKSVLKETVALCTSEIENMRTHLMPLFQSTEGRKMDLKHRARWLFAKSKVSTTKASLDSMKVTLGLLLHTIEYIEGKVVEDFIEEDIHEMIETSKGTKGKFLKAQRIDMTVEVIYNRITSQKAQDEGPEDELQPPTDPHKLAKVSNGDEITFHSGDLAVLQWASNGMIPGSENQNLDLDRVLTAETRQASISTEWTLVEALSDESFLQIADHMRLHKKVAEFALDTISRPEKNEDQDFVSEQTIGASDGVQGTEEEESERSYQPARSEYMDDDERQETVSTSSAQYTARPGQRPSNNARGPGQHPQGYCSDTQEHPHVSRSRLNEAQRPVSDSWRGRGFSSPNASESFNEGAPSSRRSDPYPDFVHSFVPPRAFGQEPSFYSNEPPGIGNPFVPGHFEQTGHFSSDRQTSSPRNSGPNPQMEAIKAQLALLQQERKRQEDDKERAQYEKVIREDAEKTFRSRMEEMQRAQGQAKKEIELAKIAAEKAARERLEEERKAENEKERQYAEVLSKAHREARQNLEREALERKQRQGLRGLFNRSPKD